MASNKLPSKSALGKYMAENIFSAKYLLCCSDVQSLTQKEVLAMADDECRELWDNLSFAYTVPQGNPILRKEVAKLHGVDPEDILTAPQQEALYLAMNCLILYLKKRWNQEQLHVISMFPAFQSLYEHARTGKCDVEFWTGKFTDKGWEFDFNEFKKMVKPNTHLAIVNFPHNPTAFHPSLEDFMDLVDFCKSNNIFLFSDEMYRFTNIDESKPLPSPSGLYDDAMTLFGLSKTTGCPGLRMGWLATRNKELRGMMSQLKGYTSQCSSSPSEVLSIIVLRNLQTVVDRSLGILRKNLNLLDQFFAKYPDIFEWHAPSSCVITLVKVKGWVAKIGKGKAEGFTQELLEEADVLVVPSNIFEMDDEFVRIGFGHCNLPEVLEQLENFLERNKPREEQN